MKRTYLLLADLGDTDAHFRVIEDEGSENSVVTSKEVLRSPVGRKKV